MVADGSVDFAVSLDSLVHVEPSVLESYLVQLCGKLSEDGIGFFHHSNLGRYKARVQITKRTPSRLRGPLVKRGTLVNLTAWRDEAMTVEAFDRLCAQAGLACVGQEEISWVKGKRLTDAFSVFTRRGSRRGRGSGWGRGAAFRLLAFNSILGECLLLRRSTRP